jgi:MFS transporter, OFA family, oxalate/formate antiporter
MGRWIILAACIIMQLALGGVYAWSAFVPALRKGHELHGWQAGLIFGTTILVFTLSMIVSGRSLEKTGPRWMAAAGGLIYGAGYLVAGYSPGDWGWLWLGVGVMGGIGIGMGYVCPLTTSVRWFPANKGFVTGVAVAGFGGGAILLAEVAEILLTAGWSPLRIFRAMGFTLASIICLCALTLRFPGPPPVATTPPLHGMAVWRDPRFIRLLAGMFGGTFGGLLVIGHLKPIALVAGLSSGAGALAVSAFALGNTLGRMAWGMLHDRFGYVIIPTSMSFLAFSLLGLLDSGVAWRFVGASLVAGFGFGGCFVVFAADIAATYGVSQVARLYPKVFLAYGLAGVTGPLLGGLLYDLTGNYVAPVLTATTVAALGALVTWRLRDKPCSA